MRKARIALVLACLSVNVQAEEATSQLFFYTVIGGADYTEYICHARTSQPILENDVTQIVDVGSVSTFTTVVAHGLGIGAQFLLTGATGAAAALNGTQVVVTVPSATTFTIATSGLADATYNNAGISYTSGAPRTTRAIWKIEKYYYGGTGGTSVVAHRWAIAPGKRQGSDAPENICDNRASATQGWQ